MKRAKFVYFLLLVFWGTNCQVPQKILYSNSLYGTYVHKTIKKGCDYHDYSLTLCQDKTFMLYKFNTGSCIDPDPDYCADERCRGKWEVSKDTVFLYCRIQHPFELALTCAMQKREYVFLIRGNALVLQPNRVALTKQDTVHIPPKYREKPYEDYLIQPEKKE